MNNTIRKREAFNKKKIVTNVTLALIPLFCDEKPSAFFWTKMAFSGGKMPIQLNPRKNNKF